MGGKHEKHLSVQLTQWVDTSLTEKKNFKAFMNLLFNRLDLLQSFCILTQWAVVPVHYIYSAHSGFFHHAEPCRVELRVGCAWHNSNGFSTAVCWLGGRSFLQCSPWSRVVVGGGSSCWCQRSDAFVFSVGVNTDVQQAALSTATFPFVWLEWKRASSQLGLAQDG